MSIPSSGSWLSRCAGSGRETDPPSRANLSTTIYGDSRKEQQPKKSGSSDAAGSKRDSGLPDAPVPDRTKPGVSTRRLRSRKGPGYRLHPAQFSICKHNGFHAVVRSGGELVPIFAEQLFGTRFRTE